MKFASPFLVLVCWISSWLPTSLDKWPLSLSFVCIFGLCAAFVAQERLKDRRWPAKMLRVLAVLVLISGAFLAILAWSIGTSVDGAITFFYVVGFAGYLHMISRVLTPGQAPDLHFGTGFWVLFLLASWSWVSALGMFVHRGASGNTDGACILVPKPVRYGTELSSIWEMRLPHVATSRTGPTGTIVFDYHAILVAPAHERTEVYNWSKRRMRFEILDTKRNPYLPTLCP
ncbi:hypothetical protein PH5382_03484 [Phaeobacter sp. CECT 5382]|nr:hypothetical protein PH5382_03484 [Phaeobacter sp. CECT 5382]